MAKKSAIGFGFEPQLAMHHFLINIPKITTQNVSVYERFYWVHQIDSQHSDLSPEHLKVSLSRKKFDLVKDCLLDSFNFRLKEMGISSGRFKVGQVAVERLLGKEMVLLLWAIEDCDPGLIPVAINNWLCLSREERWWLFTMTNNTSGLADDKRGWRIAIHYALAENQQTNKQSEQQIVNYHSKNA